MALDPIVSHMLLFKGQSNKPVTLSLCLILHRFMPWTSWPRIWWLLVTAHSTCLWSQAVAGSPSQMGVVCRWVLNVGLYANHLHSLGVKCMAYAARVWWGQSTNVCIMWGFTVILNIYRVRQSESDGIGLQVRQNIGVYGNSVHLCKWVKNVWLCGNIKHLYRWMQKAGLYGNVHVYKWVQNAWICGNFLSFIYFWKWHTLVQH